MSNKYGLLNKIKALAERGADGEKENAQLILSRIMEELGITFEDIDNEKLKRFYFKKPKNMMLRKLFFQILSTVLSSEITYSKLGRYDIALEMTPTDYIEVKAKLDFYLYHFNKDLELFFLAYIQKNDLFPIKSANKDCNPTKEEIDEWYKAMEMSKGLSHHGFNKRIENKKE
jgi:hypothetical protein